MLPRNWLPRPSPVRRAAHQARRYRPPAAGPARSCRSSTARPAAPAAGRARRPARSSTRSSRTCAGATAAPPPVSALKTVDLPLLGSPTRPTSRPAIRSRARRGRCRQTAGRPRRPTTTSLRWWAPTYTRLAHIRPRPAAHTRRQRGADVRDSTIAAATDMAAWLDGKRRRARAARSSRGASAAGRSRRTSQLDAVVGAERAPHGGGRAHRTPRERARRAPSRRRSCRRWCRRTTGRRSTTTAAQNPTLLTRGSRLT